MTNKPREFFFFDSGLKSPEQTHIESRLSVIVNEHDRFGKTDGRRQTNMCTK